ncbi:MAG: SH3 domain-containing protein [Desulfobacterales bacterium]|nr:SH3 domain-containing protein [Desulfobacterales bacterium]
MKKILFFTAVLLLFTFDAMALAQRMSVSASIANIRMGPGTKYDTIWQVERHYPIKVLKKSGQWLQFRDFEGDEGWIHKSLVAKTPTVITIKEKCNIRSGPGARFKVLGVVEKGIPFKVLKRKGAWFEVKHADGDGGWIYQTLVW